MYWCGRFIRYAIDPYRINSDVTGIGTKEWLQTFLKFRLFHGVIRSILPAKGGGSGAVPGETLSVLSMNAITYYTHHFSEEREPHTLSLRRYWSFI